jgi:hypothetical protein
LPDLHADLRRHLLNLLRGKEAHTDFDTAIRGIPPMVRGQRPSGAPHSLWELLEHMRIAQWDILEFSRNPNHVSPDWPAGYWPQNPEPSSAGAWDRAVESFRSDLKEMEALVENAGTDLFARIPHGDGQTVLREALLVADHNAYHLGQLALAARLLSASKSR